jgi:hypothetical protein
LSSKTVALLQKLRFSLRNDATYRRNTVSSSRAFGTLIDLISG